MNYMDYGLQLGRRFRALKLWFVLRHFGVEGIRDSCAAHIALAQIRGVGARRTRLGSPRAAPALGRLLSLRAAGSRPGALDELNERLMHAVNATGEIFISHTRIDGVFALRLAIGNLRTQRADVEFAWRLLRASALSLAEEMR